MDLKLLRTEGDSWKDACNSCGCGPNGLTFCTTAFCGPIFAKEKGTLNTWKCCIKNDLSFLDEFLLTEDATKDTSLIPQCRQDGVKTCQAVNVDFRNLKDGQIVKLIRGSTIQLQVNFLASLYMKKKHNNYHFRCASSPQIPQLKGRVLDLEF